jgi:hypothetical protein
MSSVHAVSRRLTRFVPALASALLLTAPALAPRAAGDDQPAAAPSPSPSPEPPKVDVVGFVDVYYGYNFNKVDPALRTFDVQHNTFSLSLAELNFTKTPTADSRVGFRADLDFGKTADLVAAYEPESSGKEIYKHVQQAYVSLLTGKVQWDAGKFVTPMGAEVIESQDNWNYSRSILFGYAIPFYHVGLRATYTLDARTTLGAQLVNGWNNSSETNGDKTVHLSLTLKPDAKLTWVANYMVGKEAPAGAAVRDVRNLFDTTLTYAATPKLSLQANVDYGKEGAVKWWGVDAYAKYQATPAWALVGRYEYVDDSKGGFMTIGGKAQSFTLTSDHLIAGGLKTRLEYRLDHAPSGFFSKSNGGTTDNQSTLTVGIVYLFSGKI